MKHEHNCKNIAQGLVRKEDGIATFDTYGNEVRMRMDAASKEAVATPTHVKKDDVRRMVENYIRELVVERNPKLIETIDGELTRRVEVVIKDMESFVRSHVKDALAKMIHARIQATVADLKIDLAVTVTPPSACGPEVSP